MNFFQIKPVKQYAGPEIVVSTAVLRQMYEETLKHPPTETGQALLGIRTKTQIVVLGVIPDLENTVREAALFVQGGQDQYEIFQWYNKHWKVMRESSRGEKQQTGWTPTTRIPKGTIPKELDLPLTHVGDWHRHPGNMRNLSGTDLGTIDEIFSDQTAKRNEWLAPIVTIPGRIGQISWFVSDDQLVAKPTTEIHYDWYYTHVKDPTVWRVPVTIAEPYNLPWIPPLPWHLVEPDRMRYELGQMNVLGWNVRWAVKQMDGDPEMEIIFAIDYPSWNNRYLIITDHNYPQVLPKAKVYAKKKAEEAEESKPVNNLANLGKWLRKIVYGSALPQDDFFRWTGHEPDVEPLLVDYMKELIQHEEAKHE